MVHEQKFKDPLSSTCQVSIERRVLDLESEAMKGLGSIPIESNIFSLDFFCFHAVKTKMAILAFLCVCEKPDGAIFRILLLLNVRTKYPPIFTEKPIPTRKIQQISKVNLDL